jgi:hypothetical protein
MWRLSEDVFRAIGGFIKSLGRGMLRILELMANFLEASKNGEPDYCKKSGCKIF